MLGYSTYKILNVSENKYFHINYLDCRYWSGYGTGFPYSIDIFILYEGGTFKFRNQSQSQFTNIQNGSTITVWENVFPLTGHETDCFELYLTLSDNNNYPYLTWNDYFNDDFTPTHFKIYRAVVGRSDPPPTNYTLVRTQSVNDDRNWTDYDFVIGGINMAYYKVMAFLAP